MAFLIQACRNNDSEKVFFYLERGLDPDSCDDSGLSCLTIASANGNLEIVRMLILVGAEYDLEFENPLVHASANGHLSIVKLLVEVGANIFIQQSLPLLKACQNGHLEIVQFLFKAGLDLEIDGTMALLSSIKYTQPRILEHLLDLGVDLHYQNDLALFLATCDLEMTQLLVSRGANINAVVEESKVTPLIVAIRKDSLEVVKFLISQGADLNFNHGSAILEAFYRASFNFERSAEMKEDRLEYPSELESYEVVDFLCQQKIENEELVFKIVKEIVFFKWINRKFIFHLVEKPKGNLCRLISDREILPRKRRRLL